MRGSLAIVLLVVFGCGDDARQAAVVQPDSSADAPDLPPPTPPPGPVELPDWNAPIVWEPCPVRSLTAEPPEAECARIAVPARWEEPDGPTIAYFLKRLPDADSYGQLWLLQGGPGGSGADMDAFAAALAPLVRADIYIPDHRGTGRSTRLGCDVEESDTSARGPIVTAEEWPACLARVQAAHGGVLDAFTTTQAAWDVGALVDRMRRPQAPERDAVFIFGVSYGTYWAHRYLQLFPAQASGVVLDSVCSPRQCDLSRYDAWYDGVGRELLAHCAADAACAARLGGDPLAALSTLFDALDAGHCPALADLGLDRAGTRRVLGELLRGWYRRVAIPAVVQRLQRCAPGDILAIANLLEVLGTGVPRGDEARYLRLSRSSVLGYHVMLSELWAVPEPPVAELEMALDETYMALGIGPPGAQAGALPWPRYPRDGYWGRYAETDVPVLMLNGTLDPQTPLSVSAPLALGLTGPNHYLVEVPLAAHAVVSQSPQVADLGQCGLEIMFEFMSDPGAAPSASCRQFLLPIDFDGYGSVIAEALFGTTDLWGPESVGTPNALVVLDEVRLERARRALERLLVSSATPLMR